jgi:hypothetical protein
VRKAVALVLVAAGAAAGAWLARPHGSSTKTLAPIPFDLRQANGFSRLTVLFGSAPKPEPQMSALRRPRIARDAIPRAAREQVAHTVPASSNDMSLATSNRRSRTGPGAIDVTKSRLLLEHLGTSGSSLYAVPTANGWVCYVLSPELVSQCASRFADELVWLSVEQTQSRTVATGIVPDRVRQVSLAVGKDTHVATLARNGFFDELPGATADELDAVIVKTKEGRTFRLPLDRRIFQQ